MSSNNFGVGLPPASKNQSCWHLHRPLLEDPSLVPDQNDIQTTHCLFLELLGIRNSSTLFHLPSSLAIKNQATAPSAVPVPGSVGRFHGSQCVACLPQVTFNNTGPAQMPGVIVMQIVSADLLETVSCSHEDMDGVVELPVCPKFRRDSCRQALLGCNAPASC